MYFASRVQAGRMLASQLVPKYRHENCLVLALSDGGVVVGAQIASQLHCALNLLMTAEIDLPREPIPVAGITPGGVMTYNHDYSQGEIDDLVGENFGYIEQEKMTRMHDMNHLLGKGGVIDRRLIRGHNIIVVSDGLKNGFLLDLAAEFLKPIVIGKLIIATPLASVQAVDRMHILADEIYCLSVVADYLDTPHYYDQQDIPAHETVVKTVQEITSQWK